jgi:hypothetical protein
MSTLLHGIAYVLRTSLNELVQIANKMGLQQLFFFSSSSDVAGNITFGANFVVS